MALFTELPRRVLLGNWASGVRNSRKLNLCHYSFLETLYVGLILYGVDWGYTLTHEQLSGVWSSRKPSFVLCSIARTSRSVCYTGQSSQKELFDTVPAPFRSYTKTKCP